MLVELDPPFMLVRPIADEREFYELGEDAGWELLDGRLVRMSASDRHEDLFGFLQTLLRGWLDERGGGVVRGSRYPMRLDAQWSSEPDLLVVLDATRPRMTSQRLEGPADLVIEIASDGDPGLDEREKLPRYQQAGVPEMWFVSPQRHTIRAERLRGDRYETERRSQGTLASVVLPGFALQVEDLWADPLPSSIDRLRRLLR